MKVIPSRESCACLDTEGWGESEALEIMEGEEAGQGTPCSGVSEFYPATNW